MQRGQLENPFRILLGLNGSVSALLESAIEDEQDSRQNRKQNYQYKPKAKARYMTGHDKTAPRTAGYRQVQLFYECRVLV